MEATALGSKPIFHVRTKHIEFNYHFVCKKVLNRDILIRYITSTDQVVDVFTKGLTSTRFLFLLDHAMGLKGVVNQSQTSETE